MTLPKLNPVDRAFDDMRARARAGQPVRADDYLDPADPASADPDRILDLVYAEYLARQQTDTPASATELAARYPHLADRIQRQLQLDEALESAPPTESGGTRSSVPATASTLTEPAFVRRYRIITKLGAGGQGTVYRAFHPDLERDVVIKIARQAADPGELDTLRAEARVLASLDHPDLARVYDLDAHEGCPFVVMEYVAGQPLDVAASTRPISAKQAAELVARAATALAHAHRRGIVHRDIKPQNILINDAGRVWVIDFGLAALLKPASDDDPGDGSITGTLRYMAPEQARGETATIGPRTDVFGLGGVLYFLLTGSPPYAGARHTIALERAANGDWGREKLNAPHIPPMLRAVCEKAMTPNAAGRYPTADAMAVALRHAMAPPRRRVVAGMIGILAAVAAFVFLAWTANREPREPTAKPTPPDLTTPPQPEFKVRVWNENQERYRDIIYELPLRTGQGLRYEVATPADRHLALLTVDSTGGVRLLTETGSRPETGTLAYPVDPKQKAELMEPDGTVVVLLCGRAGSPVTVDEVRAALGAEQWPLLPKNSVLVIECGKVFVAGTQRGVGSPTGQADPEGDVLRRLDAARVRLSQTCDVLAGVAFSHR